MVEVLAVYQATAPINHAHHNFGIRECIMNNKKLANLIKQIRKKKLQEQDPKAEASAFRKKEQFKPVHIADPYDPKDASPNDYLHRMAEAVAFRQQGVGARHNPRHTVGNISKLPSDRMGYQSHGNQGRSPSTYGNTARPVAEEETDDLGTTETKKKSQKVTMTPEIEQFGKQ